LSLIRALVRASSENPLIGEYIIGRSRTIISKGFSHA